MMKMYYSKVVEHKICYKMLWFEVKRFYFPTPQRPNNKKKSSKNSYFLHAHFKLKILLHLNSCFAFKIFNSLPFECLKCEFNISFSYRVMKLFIKNFQNNITFKD